MHSILNPDTGRRTDATGDPVTTAQQDPATGDKIATGSVKEKQ